MLEPPASTRVVALALVLSAGCKPETAPSLEAPAASESGPPPTFVELPAVEEPAGARLSLHQAAFDWSTLAYVYAHADSIPELAIVGAPADADRDRVAMLHDGDLYRLYMFRSGRDDAVYQFAYDPATLAYTYGFRSVPELAIVGAPADASARSFAMLHDGARYRLYMRSETAPTRLYQFAFNPTSGVYEFGYDSIPELELVGSPAGVDHERWAMLHDGEVYRYYAFARGRADLLHQFAFNAGTGAYEYGHDNSIPQIPVVGMPAASDTSDFVMLHDGADYRFYLLALASG